MQIKSGRNILLDIVLLTSILLTTIVYSAFNIQLQISGEAIVRSDNDIRVTNVKVLSQTNNAYETYNSKYTKDTTSMFVTLPSNSSITYEVEITNKTDDEYKMNRLEEISNDNSNITISSVMTNKVIFESDEITKYTISLNNNTNNEEKINLNYKYNFVLHDYYEEAQEKFVLLKTKTSGHEGV